MLPTYPYSLSSSSNSNSTYYSTMPIIDLNIVDDQSHELIFSPTHQPSSSSSSLSSCPILFSPSHHHQDHAGSSHWESKNLQNDHDEASGRNIIASRGSWNDPDQEEKGGGVEMIRKSRGLKLKVWKRSSAASGSLEKEDNDENHNHNHNQTEDNNDSAMKWMPSKMRMMRKMMVASSDHNHISKASSSSSSEDQNQGRSSLLLSPRGTDHNSSSSNNNSSTHSNSNNHSNHITVRVCSDCHTTKTPLWRSGPRGPKSLCNACGIRQRKARRAMAAAAAIGGSPDRKAAVEKSTVKGTAYKVHGNKGKKLKLECESQSHHQMKKKKKHKLEDYDDHHQAKEVNDNGIHNNNNSRGRSSSSSSSIINKFSFEDFTVSLMGKNLAAASQVFPQDEKEAAILLMALSCNGLVHG